MYFLCSVQMHYDKEHTSKCHSEMFHSQASTLILPALLSYKHKLSATLCHSKAAESNSSYGNYICDWKKKEILFKLITTPPKNIGKWKTTCELQPYFPSHPQGAWKCSNSWTWEGSSRGSTQRRKWRGKHMQLPPRGPEQLPSSQPSLHCRWCSQTTSSLLGSVILAISLSML